MAYQLAWLAQVLRGAGLKVAEQPGWLDRGRSDMGTVRGVVCHHTGVLNPDHANMPTLRTLGEGRSDLAGPRSQLGLGRDGTYYVIAAGKANHAGEGSWKGVSGNGSLIGIEGENSGNEPWPDVQMDAYRRGVAAILTKLGLDVGMCCGHREYAPHRKTDPVFDMDEFRAGVRSIMLGTVAVRPLIPAMDDRQRSTLRRGDRGDLVRLVQTQLGLESDGIYGPNTEAAVRRFQLAHDLVPDGIVGPASWKAIDAERA
jgi:hypothetical protein